MNDETLRERYSLQIMVAIMVIAAACFFGPHILAFSERLAAGFPK